MTSVERGNAERLPSKGSSGDGWSEDGRGRAMTGPILREIIAIMEEKVFTGLILGFPFG